MRTYTTLDGTVLDLAGLSPDEQAFLERCTAAYRAPVTWEQFSRLVEGDDNPLLHATGGRVTRTVWAHPLFQALLDLEGRLAIQEGAPVEPGEDPDRDPFADEWLSVAEAAQRKQVTVQGLHQAIQRGLVVAAPARPGGTRLVVSANSLARWTPVRARQAAGRKRAGLAAGA